MDLRNGYTAALATIGTLLAGCSGGGSDSAPTTLSVSLMDAPVDGVTAVFVQIKAIWLKGPNGPATELPLIGAPVTVNLLGLTEENAALLVHDAPIPAGTYEWLAMDVNADFDGYHDSYVTTESGGQYEIRVPSGRVRLVSGFEVAPSQAAELLFDWDLRQALVEPPGHEPGYLLKPAFRVIDVTEFGALRGTVSTSTIFDAADKYGCKADDAVDLEVGNIVYVYAGVVSPDDIDGLPADPVATVRVTQNPAGEYVYRTIIAPGPYTVAFTCQAAKDFPEVDESVSPSPSPIVFIAPATLTISADVEAIVDF